MPTFDALGVPIGVPTTVAPLLASLPADDRDPAATVTSTDPVLALAELTQHAVALTRLLCVHAGVVRGSGGIVAFPGESGLGKTTLVSAFLRAGCELLSDEALALDPATAEAVPFPRPLGLAADVWPLLGPAAGPPPEPGTERLIPPAALGRVAGVGGPVRHIVLAQRQPGPASVAPAPRSDAVVALLRRSFNHFRAPEASFRTVVRVVRGAQVWHARYEDAPDLVAALGDQLAATRRK